MSDLRSINTSADLMRHYGEVRARLGAANPVLAPAPTASDRLKRLVLSDTSKLPYIRAKRKRDVIKVESLSVTMPASSRKIVVREVCEKHGVSWLDIMSNRRGRQIVAARNEAFYRLRNETEMSFPEIGRLLGGKDHSTVIHGIRRYQAALAGREYKPSWRGRSCKAFDEAMGVIRE